MILLNIHLNLKDLDVPALLNFYVFEHLGAIVKLFSF